MTLFLSREGYFKKITQQSLRMSGEQKYKDGDSLRISLESSNRCDLLIFTDRQQIYKLRLADMEETKASALGVYLPSRLQMDDGESVLTMVLPGDYKRQLLLVFENGKVARLECSAYETKTNRKKLVNAYSDKSPLAAVIPLDSETDIACYSSDDRSPCLQHFPSPDQDQPHHSGRRRDESQGKARACPRRARERDPDKEYKQIPCALPSRRRGCSQARGQGRAAAFND